MDPNVLAAVISVSGSAVIAGTGALVQWHRRRRKRRTYRQLLDDLRQHPVLSLEDDGALLISCQDTAKAGLLNAIRVRVICEPVRTELALLLALLRQSAVTSSLEGLEVAITRLREQLLNSQRQAMYAFPLQTHDVVRKLIASHGDALATTSDAFASRYDVQQVLELVFNVFYVSTFTLLSQWAQAANQLNGHLNGLSWEGRLLEYVFQGNTTDAIRILNTSLSVMRDTLQKAAGFICIVDASGTIRAVTSGTKETLGYDTQGLAGLSFSALQLGLDGLDSNGDIRSLLSRESEALHAALPVRSQEGSVRQAQMCANRVRFTLPEVQYYLVAMVVLTEDTCAATSCNEEDAHTRMAFCLSSLTHPTRRAVAACAYSAEAPAEVNAVEDGAPDLPIFLIGKALHMQMEVPSRRVEDMYARCALRLQKDLLRSATMTYTWRNRSITAEFFLIGCNLRQALVTVHRPTPPEELPDRRISRREQFTTAPRTTAITGRLGEGGRILRPWCFRAPARED